MLVGEVDELLDLYHEACNMVALYFLDEAHIPLNDSEKKLTTYNVEACPLLHMCSFPAPLTDH